LVIDNASPFPHPDIGRDHRHRQRKILDQAFEAVKTFKPTFELAARSSSRTCEPRLAANLCTSWRRTAP
jgi:hypothetical protein